MHVRPQESALVGVAVSSPSPIVKKLLEIKVFTRNEWPGAAPANFSGKQDQGARAAASPSFDSNRDYLDRIDQDGERIGFTGRRVANRPQERPALHGERSAETGPKTKKDQGGHLSPEAQTTALPTSWAPA